ncbi:MAG: sugar phosphate isomerase/epimerase [Palaeococcus sp.]|uniref:sugar phosphate isomerase/epimerase family protein n=1 Tax=Palaeococcus sp. (in: euryarchaeotes) TaxID=2820298 RepID=UPI0025F81096|nr:sugar phosphate isomerase/epimerase [Palaeococcus sp. (in: euryarchaeotes)]MCD6559007.1 sugar phosphate isomerase/epimerase [Palaeococcus sp. (in: euryarchaeotes)]
MRVGVSIYPQFVNRDKTLASVLADMKIKQYDFVEIFPHTLGLIKNGEVVEGKLKHVETTLRGVGIDYIFRMPMSVNLRDHIYYSRHFKVAKSIVDLAINLGAKVIVMQSGRAGRLDLEIEAITELASLAENFGIKIALENTFSVKDTLYVVENVNKDNVGFALDVGHAFLSAQGDEEKFLEDVKLGVDKAILLLVHDNFGKLTPQVEPLDALAYGVGDLHLLPGEGKIPFGKLMKMFTDGLPILVKIKDPEKFRKLPNKRDMLNLLRSL